MLTDQIRPSVSSRAKRQVGRGMAGTDQPYRPTDQPTDRPTDRQDSRPGNLPHLPVCVCACVCVHNHQDVDIMYPFIYTRSRCACVYAMLVLLRTPGRANNSRTGGETEKKIRNFTHPTRTDDRQIELAGLRSAFEYWSAPIAPYLHHSPLLPIAKKGKLSKQNLPLKSLSKLWRKGHGGWWKDCCVNLAYGKHWARPDHLMIATAESTANDKKKRLKFLVPLSANRPRKQLAERKD